MRSPLPRLLLMLALIVFARPGLGQSADLKPLLAGTANIPLTMKLGDLNGDWRRVSIGLQAQWGRPRSIVIPDGAAIPDFSQDDVYYTKGDTATVGMDEFLVVYHVRTPTIIWHSLMAEGGQPPPPAPLAADTVLTLSLLNLHDIVSLSDIRPFDLGQEVTAEAQSARAIARQQSLDNLRQIGLAMLQYTQDNDETLPPMTDAATVKKTIYPYVKSDSVFVDPLTDIAYLPNTSLSHRTLATFNSPAEMVIYYEATPAPDNTRALLFLDGHVKRVPEADWPRLKAASHVPNTPSPSELPPGNRP